MNNTFTSGMTCISEKRSPFTREMSRALKLAPMKHDNGAEKPRMGLPMIELDDESDSLPTAGNHRRDAVRKTRYARQLCKLSSRSANEGEAKKTSLSSGKAGSAQPGLSLTR